ncbi:SpoIID/LytB domain-containing protein [Picosynechococcus sp. PCC 8807]|uniref:SpoIID/LytB domain-containing protein n=1 Tax=Picosynechococcus sp. PCC 8807 TaxID=195248 RepID=UPI00081044B1|nr:SpoIID/LytB domain-containing protein [Picosynechococcus sp. PCC 8807]ANV90625.1 amidase [Picosynechococcus sp. PCC 8807]
MVRSAKFQGQWLGLGLWIGLGLWGPGALPGNAVEIEVGIVQRFGEEQNDTLTISSLPGDRLEVDIISGGQQQTLQTNQVTLEVAQQPLPQAELAEYIVLSDQGTFETAEDSAKFWRSLGIEVEITQPGRWQVWAKRDVYQTPLLRRLLLQELKAKGYTTPYLSSTVRTEKAIASFVVGGYRYNRANVTIRSRNGLFNVQEDGGPESRFAGELRLQSNAYGTFTLVNDVDIEVYLRGVVPHEIGPNAPDNAVEAQTIIARTYALRNLRRFEADNYELCATIHCQVYKGLQGTSPRIDQAIARTKGLVLTYNNELVDALYSSTTGGVTASFSDVWDGAERPYLKAVIDSPNPVWDLKGNSLADEQAFRKFIALNQGFNETGRTVFRWERSATLQELATTLQTYLERTQNPLAGIQTVQKLEIKRRSPSGRVLELDVTTDRGIVKLLKNEIRSALGPPRSTLFYLQPNLNPQNQLTGYTFVGGGFGHGVGMSQYGSYNLANLGWSAARILQFYYPGTTLQPLDESIVFWRETP